MDGMEILSADTIQKSICSVWSEAAARRKRHNAELFVLATGGILGGGIQVSDSGYAQEPVFDLPLADPVGTLTANDRSHWFQRQFLTPSGHPIFRVGLAVNDEFRSVDDSKQVVFDNLTVAGTALGHCDPIQERSLDGIALVTGYVVGNQIGKFSQS